MKFIAVLLSLLSLFSCAGHSGPEQEPVVSQAPILPVFERLNTLHGQFLVFRDDDVFQRYGFTYNSPYADWLQRVRDFEQDPATGEAARLLAGLSVAYRTHGAKSRIYRQFEDRFGQALRAPAAENQAPPPVVVSEPVSLPIPEATARYITLLFSGDTQGVIYSQPGGGGPVGGLARRPPTIDHFRSEDPGIVVLDAGDAFVSGFAKAAAINKVLVRAMNLMRYDAMGLGPHDLAIGEVMLRELASIASFPMICSNLQFQKGVEPWIKPYVLIKRDQARIALVNGGYIARRSGHNHGHTVDLTLIDLKSGRPLEMGTDFDTLSPQSHTLRAEGKALENRLLLRKAMTARGFRNYSKEWWHYRFPMEGTRARDVPYACFEPDEGKWSPPKGWNEAGFEVPKQWEARPCPAQ